MKRGVPHVDRPGYAGPPVRGPYDRETRNAKVMRLAVLAANIRLMLAEYAELRGALFPDELDGDGELL